jgi:hypothetical protein
VYPVLVNELDVKAVATSEVIDCVVSDSPPTKFDLNVTVFGLAVHLACNVNPDVNVTESPFAYTTEPPELVAHPAKVYPVLVNAFDVNGVEVLGVID